VGSLSTMPLCCDYCEDYYDEICSYRGVGSDGEQGQWVRMKQTMLKVSPRPSFAFASRVNCRASLRSRRLAETRGDSRTHMLQSTLAASQTLLPSDAVYACPFSGWTQGSVSKQALPHTVSVHICQVSEMRCGVCVRESGSGRNVRPRGYTGRQSEASRGRDKFTHTFVLFALVIFLFCTHV